MAMTLFAFPGACSRATMLALEETGAEYEVKVANLMRGEQNSEAYREINPKGKVPVLVVDGAPLTENVAILGYLADRFPGAELLPSDPLQRAQGVSAVAWLSSSLLPAGGRIGRPERTSADAACHDSIRARAREEFLDGLRIAERHLVGRHWWLDAWSIADAYLFYIHGTAERLGVAAAEFPALAKHRARLEARAATQHVLAWERDTMTKLGAPQ
jgi:glutathione S-transferase